MYKSLPIVNKHFKDLNPLDFGFYTAAPGLMGCIFPFILIHYVTKGAGVLNNKRGQFEVKKDDMFFIYPDEITSYYPVKENPWDYIWIGFDGDYSSKFRNISDSVMRFETSAFHEMLDAFKKTSSREEFLVSKLFMLYSELFEEKEQSYIDIALNFMNSNYMNGINMMDVAQHIGLSTRHLSKVFKNEIGIGPKEYLTDVRLKHAIKLLKQGYSVQMIADSIGYNDQPSFSRAFYNKYNQYPTQFNKRDL